MPSEVSVPFDAIAGTDNVGDVADPELPLDKIELEEAVATEAVAVACLASKVESPEEVGVTVRVARD